MSSVCTECEGAKIIRDRFPELASAADMKSLKEGWESDGMVVRDMDPEELAKSGLVNESRHIFVEQGDVPVRVGYARKDGDIWRRMYLHCHVRGGAEDLECGCERMG